MSALFHWIDDLPQWFQMGFVSFLTTAAILLVIYFIHKGIKFKTKLGDVVVGPDGKPTAAASVHPYDVAMMLNQFMKILTRKMEIKNFLIMRKQMNHAEERIDHGMMLFQGIYINLLKKKSIENPVSSDSFSIYRLVLCAIKVRLLHEFRSTFHDNTLSEIDELDFPAFVETKLDTVTAIVTTSLNELYFYTHDITRDELYDANYADIDDMRAIIRDIYYCARRVALDYVDEMSQLDKEVEDIVNITITKSK